MGNLPAEVEIEVAGAKFTREVERIDTEYRMGQSRAEIHFTRGGSATVPIEVVEEILDDSGGEDGE